ncbi:N-acetyltransferase family protein [Azospirillum sp. ST 5-10]|uniref:GNAT family N-acetyltransferase n=1 Tax=unclassified Azospirillum TaxID=2630922 RepID=UPI003F49CA96
MTGVAVREAVPADGPALQALAAAVDATSPFLVREPGERPAWAASRRPSEDLAAFQASGNSAVFLAEAAGQPVGYLAATGGRLARTRGVATLAAGVRADWRGRGVATRLFAAAHAWAGRAGLHRLELTVAADNGGAAALYRRLGYADEGRLHGSLRIAGADHDELLLARLSVPDDAPRWAAETVDRPPAGPAGGRDEEVAVRPAAPGDADAYLAFDRTVRGETHCLLRDAGESLQDPAHARRFLAGQAASRQAFTLVALLDGAVVGAASAWGGSPARTAHDWSLTLAVTRRQWGRGVGSRLLGAALERLADRPRLSLWVLGHNARALALYARHGFAVEATARCYARIDGRYADHVLMAVRHRS